MKHFLSIFLLLFAFQASAADFTARVVGISDGDTITVLSSEKKQTRIRLYGIDVPESGQDFGSRAKQTASELAFGKTVTIRERDKDRYGRTVAEVILPDGRSLNHEMTVRGLSWWYSKYAPHDLELQRLEAEAKAAHVGLWSQPNPIPPWEWRQGVGVPVTAGVVGNLKSHVYHKASCRAVTAMKESNKIEFATVQDAEAAGYRKAGDCR